MTLQDKINILVVGIITLLEEQTVLSDEQESLLQLAFEVSADLNRV